MPHRVDHRAEGPRGAGGEGLGVELAACIEQAEGRPDVVGDGVGDEGLRHRLDATKRPPHPSPAALMRDRDGARPRPLP